MLAISWWLAGISALCLLGFGLLYRRNRLSLLPSVALTSGLATAVAAVVLWLVPRLTPEHAATRWIIAVLLVPLALVSAFGIYTLIGLLLLNARRMLRKESRRLSNMLTLLLALGITVYLIAWRWISAHSFPNYVQVYFDWANLLVIAFALHITYFLLASALANLPVRLAHLDYIVVLGAGLRPDGSVTPLLRRRVLRAVVAYRQYAPINPRLKLVMAGGQGPDEVRAESVAMAELAESEGVPGSAILLDDKSTTTYENMVFSRDLMITDFGSGQFTAVFVTSGYHVLRAGIYARRAGLAAKGIGARTAPYYLPSAALREYIAYFMMFRRRYLTAVAISFALTVVASIILLLADRGLL